MTVVASIPAPTSYRLAEVIAFLFPRPIYATARPHELRCACWSPEHTPDEHPSVRIDDRQQLFYCDVCAKGGNAATVVRARYGYLSSQQASVWLAMHQREWPAVRLEPVTAVSVRSGDRQRVSLSDSPPAVYPYLDEHGRELYRKYRRDKSQRVPFFYRRRLPDGTWTNGLGDVRRVLYYLPALNGLPWVLVVEGEKDVETAWAHDLPATTNTEGASRGQPKWRESYTRMLVDAGIPRVYVIPDDDPPGRRHADAIVTSCREWDLETHLVTLPEHDLSDYFAAGYTRRDLVRLLRRSRG